MSRKPQTPVLNDLLDEVALLREAEQLLHAVFQERGPYQRDAVSEATWEKVRQFYGFDDSE